MKPSRLLRIALLMLLVAGLAVSFHYRDQLDPARFQTWIESAGLAAPLLFMLVYALGTVFFLPGSLLTLAGGAIFGPVWGTLYNLTGATLGAALAFLLARYLAGEWVERRTGGRLRQLKEGVENEGWRFVAFVRLVPLFPFNLLNYALGLTRIPFLQYVVASWLFMLPGAVAYTYLGYVGREAVAGEQGIIQKSLLALALLAVVGFLPRFIAILRRGPMLDVETLKQQLEAGADVLVLDVRSAEEFAGEDSHIPGAVNIPLEALPKRLDELSDWLERSIAIVCRTDKRSAKAARILVQNGFGHVHVVKSGITAWRQHGYPVA